MLRENECSNGTVSPYSRVLLRKKSDQSELFKPPTSDDDWKRGEMEHAFKV